MCTAIGGRGLCVQVLREARGGCGFCGAGAVLGYGTWRRSWDPNAGSPEHCYEHGVWKEMRARCVFCIFKTKYLEKQNVQAHLLKPGILSSLGILVG